MTKVRVLLADDHGVVRAGLRALIDAQPDMVVAGEAADGEAVWHSAETLQPHVVVMDLSMPRLNGAQATARVKQVSPETHVLALTVHEETAYIREVLQAGASGYLLKRAAAQDLIQAIRVVARGGMYLDATLARTVVAEPTRAATSLLNPRELTVREGEVLRLVARGYSNKEVAAQLGISVKTVESHKGKLMDKLSLRSRAELVRYALHHGWLQDS